MVTPATAVDPKLASETSSEAQPKAITAPVSIPVETPPASATQSAPATTPAPVSTPIPTEIPARMPSEVQILRQQLAQVEAEKQAQIAETALVNEARAVQQEAVVRGLSDDDALWVAKQYYTVSKRVIQAQQQLQAQQQYLQDKQTVATLIARDHGVDAKVLMTGNSPEEMIAIAEREKRYAAQDTRLKALEQRQVPGQVLNASNGSQAGNLVPTNDNIDKLWMDWEIAESRNPTGRANPYDAQYRKVLGR